MQIIGCGQPRSGTSMLMRMLQQGGIEIKYSVKRDYPSLMSQFRNPYGFFECIPFPTTGNFKCIQPKLLDTIEPSAKLIFIERNIEEVFASWTIVMPMLPEMRKKQILEVRKRWHEKLKDRTHLALDYDTVCKDPQKAAQEIADYLGADIPFDVTKAAAAVDLSLYIDRSKK